MFDLKNKPGSLYTLKVREEAGLISESNRINMENWLDQNSIQDALWESLPYCRIKKTLIPMGGSQAVPKSVLCVMGGAEFYDIL